MMSTSSAVHPKALDILRIARLLAAAAWAASLIVPGYALLIGVMSRDVDPLASPRFFAGLAALAGGQFVFMSLVMDRMMPMTPTWPAAAAQSISAAVFVLAFAVFAAVLLGGAS